MRFPLLTAATTAATFFFLAPSGNTQVQAHKSTDNEFSTLVVNTDTLPPTGADTMMYAVKKLVHGGQDAATTIALARMDEANAAIEKRTGVPLTDLTNSAQIFLRPITVKVIPTGSPVVDSAFTQYALQFEKEFNTAVTLPRDTIFNRLKRAAKPGTQEKVFVSFTTKPLEFSQADGPISAAANSATNLGRAMQKNHLLMNFEIVVAHPPKNLSGKQTITFKLLPKADPALWKWN